MSLEQKFLKAYDEFADAIFRHCYFRVFNRERAKELVQETFMKTWEYVTRLGESGSEIKNLKAFLYKVANNLIVDESRKKKPASLEELQEEGFEMADNTDNTKDKLLSFVEGGEIIKMLNRLEPQYRQAITMRYIDDLSPKEIAEVVGENENIISVRIHRGLEQIRKLLADNK